MSTNYISSPLWRLHGVTGQLCFYYINKDLHDKTKSMGIYRTEILSVVFLDIIHSLSLIKNLNKTRRFGD
jgi:hypothetical protein